MGRLSLEARIALAILMSSALAVITWIGVVSVFDLPGWVAGLLALAVAGGAAWKSPPAIVKPLYSLANVIDAMRQEDYAQRLRTDRGGIGGELAGVANRLSEALSRRERGHREADALLGKLLHEIDLAIFTFDWKSRLVQANPAAERLVGMPIKPGISAQALELERYLERDHADPVRLVLPGGSGRFLVRRRPFRIQGRPHTLLVLADADAALGAERREAWQSLVRVLGHEINNSLAPIKSIAETLAAMPRNEKLQRQAPNDELSEGLKVISARADTLGRFVAGYAALARLPVPERRPLGMRELAEHVAEMETRMEVKISGPEMLVCADRDQLEQALINLIKNAVDAVEDGSGEVELGWRRSGAELIIEVVDNGPGPPDSENLFVPFFTTKPGGSGIGLLLARRIAELHGGEVTLSARGSEPGACARLRLPMD